MSHPTEPHGLLLQVMAHDLLAPLTAIKWQSELLARPKLDDAKRAEYVQNISRSAELGIALSKHAHVAARVLSGAYTGTQEPGSLHETLRTAAEALREQYARHGLSLKTEFSDEGQQRAVDRELTGFLVWLIAKYFLTCASAGAEVVVRGEPILHEGAAKYALTVRSLGVEGAEYRVETFTDTEAHHALDQTFVFTYLIQRVVSLIPCTVSVFTEQKNLVVRVLF